MLTHTHTHTHTLTHFIQALAQAGTRAIAKTTEATEIAETNLVDQLYTEIAALSRYV